MTFMNSVLLVASFLSDWKQQITIVHLLLLSFMFSEMFNLRKRANNGSIKDSQQNHYMEKIRKRFRKRVFDRGFLARMVCEREIGLMLGVQYDTKVSASCTNSLSGIQINNGARFTISTKPAKNPLSPQRYFITVFQFCTYKAWRKRSFYRVV